MAQTNDTTIAVACPRCGVIVRAHVKINSVKVTHVGLNQSRGLVTTFAEASNLHDCEES